MRHLRLPLLICAATLASGVAVAQAPPTTAPAQVAPAPQAGSSNCAPSRTAPEQGSITTPDATTGQGREPLGDKLARSDGVLCPPAGVDPEIRAPTPDVGNMPVIPPPGSPGGDPTVRPK
ncbi:hypothetical protein [Rhodopseudomonas palustris]|uniref:Uncharacterized protein n=1 Tax=Rhodopseudomonas palustris (strain BisB18) TaxID=316056 RepID=Q21AM7_RHOPB